MTPPEATLSDSAFVHQFEQKTLDPTHFNHIGHIRLAWIYLQSHDLEEASNMTCSGIKAYAESLGAKDKFHYTITCALVQIIYSSLQEHSDKSWEAFVERNQDLVADALQILHQHYSSELLFSDSAKNAFVPPDLKAI